MPLKSLTEFVIYLLPGFIAIEIYRAKYPVRKRSDFANISWSIVYGIIISSAIRKIDDLFFHIRNNQIDDISNFYFIVILLFGGIVGGYLLVCKHKIQSIIGTRISFLKGLIPDPQSIWAKINQFNKDKWAFVVLDDETKYLGYIKYYRYVPDIEDQDFLLADARKVNDNLDIIYRVYGIGVYLNTKNVKRIEFLDGINE